MTRKASGTWSSDKDSVISAAAVCFYFKKFKNRCMVYQISENVNVKKNVSIEQRQSYPKSPITKDNNNKVYNINQEHQSIDITDRAVLGMDDVIKKLPDG